jgi:hypothetical protein
MRRDEAFETNLRQMLRAARGRGVPIVAAAPPLNYRDAPSLLQPPETEAAFWKGWLRFLRRDDRGALKIWEVLLPSLPSDRPDDGRSALEFLMGRAADRSGLGGRANEYYMSAMRDDWYVTGRCPAAQLTAIARIAEEEGALTADLDGAFQKLRAPELPGLDMFDDAVHWHHRYDGLVSATLIESLRKGPDAAEPPRPRAPIDDAETLATLRYALSGAGIRHPVKPVANPPPALSWRSVAYLEEVYRRRPRWFRDTKELIARARADGGAGAAWGQTPPADGAAAYWHVAEARLRRGDLRGALRDLDEALKLEPRSAGALVSRALALALSGDRAGARRSLARARDAGGADEADAVAAALGFL